MARENQYVFSAMTMKEGLKAFSEVKANLNIGWDELVIDAMCAHYGLDRLAMALPNKEKPAKEKPTAEQHTQAETTNKACPSEEKLKKKSK